MAMFSKKNIIFIILLLVTIGVIFFYYSNSKKELVPFKIDDQQIYVSIADTPQKRTLGLSGKERLEKNEGMLFIFDRPDLYQFWMKDMNFAIDIIWIDENKQIVGKTENINPETYPKTFGPPQKIKYVLETNPGLIKNEKIGSTVDW